MLLVSIDSVKEEFSAMLVTKIRKQGGAAVVTLPAEVLRQMDATIGEELSIEVSRHTVIMRPARGERRRYSLGELLTGVTVQDMQALAEDSAWAREGEPAGSELL
jgi:antitoxin ChpS